MHLIKKQNGTWYTKEEQTFNPTKNKVKIFIIKRYTNTIQVKINNQLIAWINNDQLKKYLGIFLDETLT